MRDMALGRGQLFNFEIIKTPLKSNVKSGKKVLSHLLLLPFVIDCCKMKRENEAFPDSVWARISVDTTKGFKHHRAA